MTCLLGRAIFVGVVVAIACVFAVGVLHWLSEANDEGFDEYEDKNFWGDQ